MTAPQARPRELVAWVIEHNEPLPTGLPLYWRSAKLSVFGARLEHHFDPKNEMAVRFARKEDADRIISWLEVPGHAVEHLWIGEPFTPADAAPTKREPCGDCGLPILEGQETSTVCPGEGPSYRVHRRCGKVATAHGREMVRCANCRALKPKGGTCRQCGVSEPVGRVTPGDAAGTPKEHHETRSPDGDGPLCARNAEHDNAADDLNDRPVCRSVATSSADGGSGQPTPEAGSEPAESHTISTGDAAGTPKEQEKS